MSAPLLCLKDLTVALPAGSDRRYAVEGLSLGVRPDEVLCVVGESGSGKSVIAHAAMGLLPPALRVVGGSITFSGEDLLGLRERDWRTIRAVRMAMIFQDPMAALNPLMRVGEQIGEVLRFHGHPAPKENRRRITQLLIDVGLSDAGNIERAYPFQLSGGQRQRVMIAIALALNPQLLIADEPTTALDVTTQAQILALVRDVQRRHRMGVLLITHDMGVVAEIADRVAVMRQGKIVETGPKLRVLNAPEHPYTRQLLAAARRSLPSGARETQSEIVLETRDLTKAYKIAGGLFSRPRVVEAVKGVSLSIARGETLGLVGESGSGKSTVARLIMRLIRPDGGQIRINGTDIAAFTVRQLRPIWRHAQLVFQDPYASLNPRHRIADIVAAGLIAHGTARPEALARVKELLELVGLNPGAADRYPHEFSGGQRQRIAIARALALRPEIIVADEAVSALDVTVQAQVLMLLAELRQRLGLAMLFVTHDLRVASQVCDRIAVMKAGRIVEMAETRRLFAEPQDPYTRELLASVPGRSWQAAGQYDGAAHLPSTETALLPTSPVAMPAASGVQGFRN